MEPGTLKVRNNGDLLTIFLYDMCGTIILLMAVDFSNGLTNQPIVICSCIFMAAIMAGRISGAHFNSSVSLCVYIVEGKWKENLKLLGVMVVSDLVGAFIGLTISFVLKKG